MIEEEIDKAIRARKGVFYVFKDESAKQQFIATRYHRRISVPRKRISEILFEQNQDVLEPMMEAITRLGRLPGPEEFSESSQVIERLGSLKQAFNLIRRVTDEEPWEEIAQRRLEDLLVDDEDLFCLATVEALQRFSRQCGTQKTGGNALLQFAGRPVLDEVE